MSRSTKKVAEYLVGHPAIWSVEYLGFKNHPHHEPASKYMWLINAEFDDQYNQPINRDGHLMSFCIKGGVEKAGKFFDSLQRIRRATDLSHIKSVATIPAISTQEQQGEEGRALHASKNSCNIIQAYTH